MAGGKQKGSEKTGGRKKGTPNKVPSLLKDAILKATEYAGEEFIKKSKEEADEKGVDYNPEEPMVEYLKAQAVENPNAFMTILGKVLPMQITGADGAPIRVEQQTVVFNPVGGDDS